MQLGKFWLSFCLINSFVSQNQTTASRPMRSTRFLAAIVTIAFLACGLQAQTKQVNPVITSVPSLAITPDARAAAMGNLGVASSADCYAQYWNPAKYASTMAKSGAYIGYTPWLSKLTDGIALMNIGGFYKLPSGTDQTISASLRYFSTGKMIQWDDMLNKVGQVSASELAFDIAYSRRLSASFSMAAALRYIYADPGIQREGIGKGHAFAMDIAGYMDKPIYLFKQDMRWRAGFNIKNIGTKISFDGGSHKGFIPTNLGLGTGLSMALAPAHALEVNVELNKLLVPTPPMYDPKSSELRDKAFADYYKTSALAGIFKSLGDAPGGFSEEMKEILWNAGMEYAYRQMFFARMGYSYIHPDKGAMQLFGFGAGVRYNGFTVDAAYQIATTPNNALDGTFSITLAVEPEQLKNLWK